MSWIFPAVLATVTLSIGSILERQLMSHKSSDPIAYAAWFQIVLGFVSLGIALGLNKFILPSVPALIPRFLISACLWSGSTVFSFQAMKRLGAGEVSILGSIGTVLSVTLGVIVLHNHISPQIVMGLVLILVSSWLVISQKLSFTSRTGIVYAVLSAVTASLAVVNDAVILQSYEPFSYMAVMSFLPVIPLLFLYPKRIFQPADKYHSHIVLLLFIFGFIYSIQGSSYYVALGLGAELSQLSPIIKVSTVLTVILAAVFLKERSHLLKKSLAALLTALGVILVG